MRFPALLLLASVLLTPSAAQALVVEVVEVDVHDDGNVEVTVASSDFVGEVHFTWDMDGDGVSEGFFETDQDIATFSLGVIPEPGEFMLLLVVGDDVDQILVPVLIGRVNRNRSPEFRNRHTPRAVVGREWSWTPEVVDPDGDSFELTVDEEDMPAGMVFDGVTFTWTPEPDDLLRGDPPGHYELRVRAEDEDHGNVRYLVSLQVVENTPPPPPRVVNPDPEGDEPVGAHRPTIVFANVEDLDGDALTYHVAIDSNVCFCSDELMNSGPIPEGLLETQWRVPRPLGLEPGVEKTYYILVWTNDGLADSERLVSLIRFVWTEDGGDGDADADTDADADADSDADSDADADDPGDDGQSCGVAAAGSRGPDLGAIALTALIAGLVFRCRRTPQNHR